MGSPPLWALHLICCRRLGLHREVVQRLQLTTSLQKVAQGCHMASIPAAQVALGIVGTDQLATHSDCVMLVACCRLTFEDWLRDFPEMIYKMEGQWGSFQTMRHVEPHL